MLCEIFKVKCYAKNSDIMGLETTICLNLNP